MAKWLKLYAIYTFSTSPDPCHYTTLLNVDVLNVYLTLDLLPSDSQIWCQSEDGILWRQLSTFLLRSHYETLALAGCLSRDDVVVFQQDASAAHRARDTVAFLQQETDARNASLSICACVRARGRHISSTNSDNFEPICHDN